MDELQPITLADTGPNGTLQVTLSDPPVIRLGADELAPDALVTLPAKVLAKWLRDASFQGPGVTTKVSEIVRDENGRIVRLLQREGLPPPNGNHP